MATVLQPRGRMTKPLATPYEVGDTVRLAMDLGPDDESETDPAERAQDAAWVASICGPARSLPNVGDVGVIRRIYVNDPKDGDDAFVCHGVMWPSVRRIINVGTDEISLDRRGKSKPRKACARPKNRREADAWLRRQLATLTVGGERRWP